MELIEPSATDFNKYFLKLKRHWLPVTSVFLASVVLAVIAVLSQKNLYEAEGKLLFKAERSPFLAGLGQEGEALKSFVQTQNPIASQVEVVTSSSLLQEVIALLQLRDARGKQLDLEDMRRKLKVKIIGGTDVLSVSYSSKSPLEAARVVNTLMKLYVENDSESIRSEAKAAGQFIAKQLPKTELKVQETEIALRDFRQRNHVADLVEKARVSEEETTRLDGQIADAKSALDEAFARSVVLQGQVGLNPQSAIALGTLSESTSVQGALQELQTLERQLASIRSEFQNAHPRIVSLESRKSALTQLLENQVQRTLGSQVNLPSGLLQAGTLKQSLIKDFLVSEVQRQGIARRLMSLMKSRQEYQQQLAALPSLAQRQRELERKLQAAQSTYETMLKKVQELQVAENQSASNARIIESALIPERPIFNKAKVALLSMGVLGGAFLATALIPLLELRQRSRLKFRIIQEHLGYPLLGSVPCLSSAMISERDRQDALISLIGEMYHSVQNDLKLLNSSGQIKTVVISSCRQQEGKSTLAAHLAVTMARLGRTVLLIDTNIFNPSLDKIFGTSNSIGLVDVIEDGALRLPEIKMSMTHLLGDHLHLLSSGEVSEGISNKLFTTKRLATILNYFSNNYDFIVIDTPSLEQSTLALTLGKLADGLLLVVNPDYVDKKYVHTVQKMKDSDPTVIGTVINNITAQGKAAKYPLQTKAYLSESREEYFLMRNQ